MRISAHTHFFFYTHMLCMLGWDSCCVVPNHNRKSLRDEELPIAYFRNVSLKNAEVAIANYQNEPVVGGSLIPF